MSTKLATRKTVAAPYPFLMNDTFISIVLDGERFTLSDAHPTFSELRTALANKNWKKVPHLVTVAAKIASKSHGHVTMNSQGVFYKGRQIHSSLTRRMQQMVKEGKDVSKMLKFMDNLYANPSESAINELYDFLDQNNLPIDDENGCFLAYKMVRQDYKDCYTGTVDNHPGEIVSMPRKDVDTYRHNTCSRGYHFCSKDYLGSAYGGGGRLMLLRVNPKDVVSIPSDYGYAKGRTWRYEVVKELDPQRDNFDGSKDHPELLTSVLSIAKMRKDLLANVLAHKTVRRAINRGQIKETTLRKWNYGQLSRFWTKLPHGITPTEQSKLFQNTLKVEREKNHISLKEMAEELDLNYKAVWAAERSTNLRQSTIDRYIEAVNTIVAARKEEVAVA